jgi:hypothetical protein
MKEKDFDKIFLNDFLGDDICYKEISDDVMRFINDVSIRSGEFVCNWFVVKKLDRNSFIVFADVPEEQGDCYTCLLEKAFTITRFALQRAILDFAKKEGYEIDDKVIDKELLKIK